MSRRSRKRNSSVTPPSAGTAQKKTLKKKKQKKEEARNMASNGNTDTNALTPTHPRRGDVSLNSSQTLTNVNAFSRVTGPNYTPGRAPSYTVLQNVISAPDGRSNHLPPQHLPPIYGAPSAHYNLPSQLVYQSPPNAANYPLPQLPETPESEAGIESVTSKSRVPSASPQDEQPPEWVHSILQSMTDLQKQMAAINLKMGRLESIEKRLGAIEEKMATVSELEKSVDFLGSQVQQINADIIQDYTRIQEINERVIENEMKSMRDNLLFSGLPEGGIEEIPETVIKQFIQTELNIDKEIPMERAHRIGRFQHGKCRPIVAKFSSFKDREEIRKSGPKLAGKPYGVHEQFPREINERRRLLLPLLKREKAQGRRATMVVDKLLTERGKYFVNGENKITLDERFPLRNRQGPQQQRSQRIPHPQGETSRHREPQGNTPMDVTPAGGSFSQRTVTGNSPQPSYTATSTSTRKAVHPAMPPHQSTSSGYEQITQRANLTEEQLQLLADVRNEQMMAGSNRGHLPEENSAPESRTTDQSTEAITDQAVAMNDPPPTDSDGNAKAAAVA